MPDCCVCPLGGTTTPMSFAEFYRAFPHRLVPEAWEALALAVATDRIIKFRDDRHDPMKAMSTNYVTTNPMVPAGAQHWTLSNIALHLTDARKLLHEPQPHIAKPLLLTDERPKQLYRLELRASTIVESYVLVEAHSPGHAAAIFESDPGRFHAEATDTISRTMMWDELCSHGDWTITSIEPHDTD